MAKGGRRPGAGRKPGGRNTKTKDLAERAAAQGITPLEVMLQAMRAHHAAGQFDAAARIAKDAAPYVHPRLANVELTGKDGTTLFPKLSDDELERRLATAEGRKIP